MSGATGGSQVAEIGVDEFEARLCGMHGGTEVGDIIKFFREAAELAGPVVWRAHLAESGGWGIAGKREKRVFCRFDPKPTVPHVCAQIAGASEDDLKAAGTVHRRKDGKPWVDVRDLRGAKVLEPLIFRAYREAGVALGARAKVDRARPLGG
jgi:hypothetical protein